MGAPISLLGNARGFARDFARDQMPPGYLWDCRDFVPSLVDSTLTNRGPWLWGSDIAGGDYESGILAPFVGGGLLFGQTADGHVRRIDQADPYASVDLGAFIRCRQNPLMLGKWTVWFDTAGAVVPKLIDAASAITDMPASAPHSRYGTIWGAYLVSDGGTGNEDVVWFSRVGDPTLAYDPNSFQRTALPVTGLAALRSMVLVFHDGMIERIRGSKPPAGVDPGDLILEPAFQRIGCGDARTIAYWNDNCVFADEHGVHMTDGSVIRNITTQGGISSYWRQLWEHHSIVTGAVFLDYYVVSITTSIGPLKQAVTLICDLNRRKWFRFTNVNVGCYIAAGVGSGMERLWGSINRSMRLARIGPCFFPDSSGGGMQDGDNDSVMPGFDTPWYRLGREGRKRIRFGYLSYDASSSPATPDAIEVFYNVDPQENPVGSSSQVLPSNAGYFRGRFRIHRNAYGVSFAVQTNAPVLGLRVYDLAVEAEVMESSRV
jgi:hypothetical protein